MNGTTIFYTHQLTRGSADPDAHPNCPAPKIRKSLGTKEERRVKIADATYKFEKMLGVEKKPEWPTSTSLEVCCAKR